jgi:hypothetical protein
MANRTAVLILILKFDGQGMLVKRKFSQIKIGLQIGTDAIIVNPLLTIRFRGLIIRHRLWVGVHDVKLRWVAG